MTTPLMHRAINWRQRMVDFAMHAWSRLTDAPPGITGPDLRQRVRLLSILCVSIVTFGDIGYLISHYAGHGALNPANDPLFAPVAAGNVVVIVGYIIGRVPGLCRVGASLLVGGIIAATIYSIILRPPNFDTLIMLLLVASLVASLLMSMRDTLIVLSLSLACTILLPAFLKGIPMALAINALTMIAIISLLIVVAVTTRQQDLQTIEQQAQLLARAKQQAESANQLKGVFLGMVSHELRTPLNNIMGYSDQLLMGVTGNLPPQAVEAAERIHRNGEQLKRMITDLLTLSRIEGGSLTIIHKPYALVDLIGEVDQSFREQAEGKGLEFITYVAETVPAVTVGDRERVAQILFNLVSNAVKFTDQGRVVVRVGQASADMWSVSVEDTGIGVPPRALERIFDRFYQLDTGSRRSFGGAGLGLAIAKELAVLMGGTITVKSKTDAGSIFTLTLPYISEESTRAVTPPAGSTRRLKPERSSDPAGE